VLGDQKTGVGERGKERLSDSANVSTSIVCGGRKGSDIDCSKLATRRLVICHPTGTNRSMSPCHGQ
jgi:hypothetical protein